MADYADQHFLPKSYLKNFAIDIKKKNIGIYIPNQRRYIKSGGVRKQCRRLYFYGEDGIQEKKLSVLETGFQKLVLKIIGNKELPVKGSLEYMEMLYMWIITLNRNPNASNRQKMHFQKTNELSEINPNDHQKSRYNLEFDFVGLNLKLAEDMMPMAEDLNAVLVVNNNSIPFITSDNPIVNYNQWAEKKGIISSVTGFASLGLQSFFPISPDLVIMFYDTSIYNLSENSGSVVEVNPREVFSLNLLQFLNNLETIYFNEQMSEKELLKLREASLFYDRGGAMGSKILYNERPDKSIDPNSGIYSTPVSFSAIDLKLSFLNITEFGKSYPVKNKKVLIRDSWRNAIKQYSPEQQASFIQHLDTVQNTRSID